MTKYTILRYAYLHAVDVWGKEKELADKGGELAKRREEKAWQDLKAIEKELAREEHKKGVTA